MHVDAFAADPLTSLLAQVVAILVLSRALAPVLRRLGQPMVIAEIVAGILLGPTLLGWMLPGTVGVLFAPESLGTLATVSELGLVLFMFVVGLELDPRLLRGQGPRAVGISVVSLVVPFVLGAGLALVLRPDDASGVLPLFMGTAMSATAFPVLARILAEQRLLGTSLGALGLACAAMDDVAFWCVAATVVAIARADGVGDALRTTALTLVFVGAAFGLVRPLLRRLGQRVSDPASLGHGAVALVLLLVFLFALATENLGINAIFGAFVLGVVVPKEGGLAHALATRLEDLVLVVLLPLFYAYSGARTDLRLLHSPTDWFACVAVLSVAVASKLGGTALAARLTGLSWRESGALGVLMNTRGLKELILLHLGLDLGVIDPPMFAVLVLMAVTTTVMTSPLLRRIWPAPPPATGVDLATTTDGGTFRVLLCVASGRSGAGLVTLAGSLGAGRGGRPLHALHLLQPSDRASYMLEQQRGPDADPGLQPLLNRAAALSLDVSPLAFVSTEASVDICRVAEAKETDLVLMGWHRPVVNQTLLGGTVYEVLQEARDATVGVFVDRGLRDVRRVLVPWRGSPHDRAALGIARRLARHARAEVTVLHLVHADGPTDDEARRAATEVFGDVGLRHLRTTITDDAASPVDTVLAACADGYDLVVVGVGRAWGLEPRLIGLYPERLMQRCPASLLVVRGSRAAVASTAEISLRVPATVA